MITNLILTLAVQVPRDVFFKHDMTNRTMVLTITSEVSHKDVRAMLKEKFNMLAGAEVFELPKQSPSFKFSEQGRRNGKLESAKSTLLARALNYITCYHTLPSQAALTYTTPKYLHFSDPAHKSGLGGTMGRRVQRLVQEARLSGKRQKGTG